MLPETQIKSPTILTSSGVHFNLLQPNRDDVLIEDIAKALSRICRFGGHTKEFYSVAQHSLVMSFIVAPDIALYALLHDAAEAYVGDVVSPLKALLPEYKMIEKRIQKCVFERFGLWDEVPAIIKTADLMMLATEQRDFMPSDGIIWDSTRGVFPMRTQLSALPSEEIESHFLSRFNELYIGKD